MCFHTIMIQKAITTCPAKATTGLVYRKTYSQLAHDVVTTLVFGCRLVATPDNVEATLSERCVSECLKNTVK